MPSACRCELLAGATGLDRADHQPAHPEDRPRARRLRRVPPRRAASSSSARAKSGFSRACAPTRARTSLRLRPARATFPASSITGGSTRRRELPPRADARGVPLLHDRGRDADRDRAADARCSTTPRRARRRSTACSWTCSASACSSSARAASARASARSISSSAATGSSPTTPSSAAARGDDPDRHLPELTRHHMELRGLGVINVQRSVRRRGDALVQARRARRAARALGSGARIRTARPRRCVLRPARRERAARADAGRARDELATLVEVAARNQLLRSARAITPRGRWRARLERSSRADGRPGAGRPTRTRARRRVMSGRRGPREGERLPTAARRPRARSSCSPGSRAPASRRRSARSRTSATSASTTCRRSSSRRWRSCRARGRRAAEGRASSSTCAKGGFLREFPRVWRQLKRTPGLHPSLIFLEASHAALVRRFSETRRPHPLAHGPAGHRRASATSAAARQRSARWPTRSSTRRT